MSQGAKPKRLFKVAQEFNVSTQSIVDALGEKDYKVDNKPLTKITPEMYSVLETIYGEDKARYEEHDQSRDAYREKRDSIRASGSKSVTIDTLLEPEEDTPQAPASPEDSLTPQEDKPADKKPVQEPTLEPSLEPVEEKKPEPKVEKPKETEKVAEEKPAPKKEEEKKAEKPAEPKSVDKPKKKEEAPEKVAKAPIEESETVAENEAEEKTADVEDDKEPDTIRARSKNRLQGTKVLGTIDVKNGDESDTSKKRKKRKRKKDRDTEVAEEAKPVKGKPKKEEPADESASRKKKKRIKKGKKAEVSDKDIEKKVKETMSSLQSGNKGKQRQKRRRQKRDEMAEKRELEALQLEEESSIIEVTEFITVSDVAELFDLTPTQVITSCMNMGLMVSINQRLEAETIELIADEYEKDIRFVDADTVAEEIFEEEEDSEEDLKPRAPIVTVMGHVDHGKTSLLDYIKESKVAEGEAGGITQHIGAYAVDLEDGKKITFLDTPGHEAFTAMRARGAQVTDIVILVVAADDSVMPQTIEAINHAQAAGVSIIVAINKVDKEEANAERIMQQLSEHNVLVEDWGGSVQCAKVSAKKGTGIDELLEKVLIEAELQELKANPDRNAAGIVLETKLDKGKGVVANVLVQRGTLKIGDTFVAGNHYGRVRAMENELGKRIEIAGPSTPIQMTGFDGQPQAGDKFNVTSDDKTAKDIALKRQQIKREQDLRKVKHMSLDEFSRRMSAGDVSELNIIIKGDVDGSIEALSGSLQKLSTTEVKVNIIHTGVGAISESDVLLATASNAIIIGFQVRPTANARKLAEKEEIDIRLFSIIYEAVDLVHDALEGMLSPELSEKIVASVDVRDTFKVPGIGTIAGSYVTEGKITRNTKIRLIRDGIVIFTGELSSLKRFKDDAREVAAGYECGIGIKNFNDIKVGDVIEGFEVVETKRTLDSST
ncbi:MAG: translation initiation factor IF-2 [Balneolia bacterium]|nr:translation initiation factor IF-2 [Balneolia bacterium]